MCKRLIFLISFVVVLGVANGASGATYNWTNDGDGNSWCNQFNWDPNTAVPGTGDTAVIRQPHRGPVVDCDVDVLMIDGPSNGQVMDVISGTLSTTGNWLMDDGSSTINITGSPVVNIGGGIIQKNGTVTLNISGTPTITIGGSTKFADDGGDWCEVNMSGGSLTVVGRLAWEDHGGGELNVSGGATIECGEFNYSGGDDPWTLNLNGGTMTVDGRLRAPEKSEGSGNVFINLDVGTLECGSFDHGTDVYAMDINEGMFIIDGNEVAAMNADVTAGFITAFDGTADVLVTYDEVPGKTTVKADYVQVKASDPTPDNYATNVCPGVQLSWQAGAYAVDHNVYFGPSLSDVNESADPCLDHYGETFWTPPGLELGTKYYWRVDGVDDTDMNSPWVGDIWEFTTNDGNAFDPYPEDKETVVPVDVDLHWTRGCTEDSHDVYFGTDYNDVRDATSVSHPNVVYVSRDVNNFDPCDFDYYTWYYWRIDEVAGGTIYQGKVWSFRSMSDIGEPNRILWYKFDEESGLIASDSSGYEHHGSGHEIDGQWEPNNGHFDGCLDFDGDEHVAVPSNTLETIKKEITVSVWVKGDDDHADEEGRVFDTGGGDYYMRVRIPTEDGDLLWRAGNDTNDSLVWRQASPLAWAESWHFFAFVKDENAGTMKIYFDGFEVESKSGTINSLTGVKDKAFRIGADNTQTSDYTGKLDDFRIYDYALSDIEIQGLFRGGDVDLAWAPDPYHGETGVPPDVNVSWWPGNHAAQHKVFFGETWEDVNSMTDPCAVQDACEYDPGILELDTTYYWRINEYNDPCTWPGPIWRFTVADFIIIDDFESYNETDNKIESTWCDNGCNGTGSWCSLAQETYGKPVHSGEQAMRYEYYTDAPPAWWWIDKDYAEAWLQYDPPMDWTAVDVRLVTLFFYGQAGNDYTDAEQMYVGVEDSSGLYAEMRYGDNEGEDMNDINEPGWHRWDIPFAYFSDSDFTESPNDVNFASIFRFSIGFGDRDVPVPAGEGAVYFDDIRLNLPICIPEYGPTGDLSGDCEVGLADVGVMAEQWLRSDVNANPVTVPSDANLVAHWRLDANTYDSTANAYHGTAQGAYDWVAGKDGQAIDLSDGWVVVEDEGNTPKLRPKHYVSVMAWVYLNGQIGGDERIVIKGRNDNETFGLEADSDDGAVFIMRNANNPGDVLSVSSGSNVVAGNEWIHIAGTYDQNEQILYVNGAEESSEVRGAIELFSDANDGLGIGGRYGDGADFDGRIDDVRVYDRPVTAAEIGYIACGSDGMCLLESKANFFSGEDPEVINFKDFAELFDYWGDKQLWPPEP